MTFDPASDMTLEQIIDLLSYPIDDRAFQQGRRQDFEATGILVLPGFVTPTAIAAICREGMENRHAVYANAQQHTVYLSPPDPSLPQDHPRNRLVTSSKGCLTDDQVPDQSPLRRLYDSPRFRAFLCAVLGEEALYAYADPLSSINLHFARTGQELGWHFDNSSFSITLMVQPPDGGGQFEYVPNVRNADQGDMGYGAVRDVLEGRGHVETLAAEAGTLAFFRGRNALHRVAPNTGARDRILAVLAYNAEPGIALAESARMTFYGRLG